MNHVAGKDTGLHLPQCAGCGVCGHTGGRGGPKRSPHGEFQASILTALKMLCYHLGAGRDLSGQPQLLPSRQEAIPERSHHRALKSLFFTCQISPTPQRLQLVKWGQSRVGGNILVIATLSLLLKYLISLSFF